MSEARERSDSLASVLGLALSVAVGLAVARVLLLEAKDGYLARGLPVLALRSGARHLLEGVGWSVVPALGLAWAGTRCRGGARIALALVAALLVWLFVGFRLPRLDWYVPGTYGARAKLVQVAIVVLGLGTGALVAWRPSCRLGRPVLLGGLALLASAGAVRLLLPRVGLAPDGRPDVVLVSLDTLRADRLGCYGYERPTSPELDRFAAGALVVDHAFAPQPWTLTAHATMLTGLYPSVHGMTERRALPGGVATLAEHLRAAGYTTAAVVDRVEWLQPMYGLDRGFQVWQNLPDDAAMKVERILRLVEDLGDSPLFLFAHFYDAHSDWQVQPYDAAAEDAALLTTEFDGPWERAGEDVVRATQYLVGFRERKEVPPADEVAHIAEQYDAGIRSLDRQLGRLFRGLERRGRLANAIVLITADHGEELFEHGDPLHLQLYRECVSVPFLLRAPGGRTGRTGPDGPLVSLADVLPTLLELADVPAPPTQGRSLAPLLRGEALPEREPVQLVDRALRLGLRTKEWSALPTEDDRLRLFDLRADPGERRDLSAGGGAPALAAEVEARLLREAERTELLRAHFEDAADVSLTEEGLRALEALGYGGEAGERGQREP